MNRKRNSKYIDGTLVHFNTGKKGISKKYPPPSIRFLIFSPDACSNKGNFKYDLQYARNKDDNEFTNVIDHEADHHLSDFASQTVIHG